MGRGRGDYSYTTSGASKVGNKENEKVRVKGKR